MTREQIYQIIEKDDGSSFWSHIYDVFMLCMIVLSVVPLMFWEEYPVFKYIEAITTAVFIIDYLLHWATADVRQGKGTTAFIKYPLGYHRPAEHTAKLQHPGRDIQGGKDSTTAEDVPPA